MNQACVRNDTIDAGNHHGRPQYRSVPAISDIAGTQRHLAVAGHCFSSGGRHHAWPGTRRSGRQSVRRCSPCTALCNWRQLRIAANRYLPMFLLPVACIILSIPGWLKFGIHLNAAFMSITGLLGVLATLGGDRPCVRHQTHSVAYAIADSHRIILGFLRSGRRAMAVHPSARQTVDRLFLAPHVPAIHQRQLGVGRRPSAVPVRRAQLYRHAPVRHTASAHVAHARARPHLRQTAA